jgi:deazaflavin-dependent oxidoreductase (nitroreductase family)
MDSRYVQHVPSDLALRAMNTIHRGLLKISGDRVGWMVSDMPVLELTTTGRISGRPRSVMLTSPLQEGSAIVVVASRGGDETHPAWFLNLRDNPEVEVSLRGSPKRRMMARMATPEERARLWPRVIAAHKRYAGYQQRTAREIPLVLIEPTS